MRWRQRYMAKSQGISILRSALGGITARTLRSSSSVRSQSASFCAEPIGVEPLVANEGADLDPLNQRRRADAVVTLPRQQHEASEIAKAIHQGDDLDCQTAARATDRLTGGPPLAPVPCWWTRMMVPSISAYSKSGSPDRTLKRRAKTSFSTHRRNRLKIEFQFPNISGRSRQGAPTRAIQSTASRNRRLSAADRPGSPILPGRSGATRSHCVSFRTNRSKAASHWEALQSGVLAHANPLVNVNRP